MRALWGMSSATTDIYLLGIVSEMALVAFNAVVWKYFDVEVVDTAADIGVPPQALNSDDPTQRLRAFMKLHRRGTIIEGTDAAAAGPECASGAASPAEGV